MSSALSCVQESSELVENNQAPLISLQGPHRQIKTNRAQPGSQNKHSSVGTRSVCHGQAEVPLRKQDVNFKTHQAQMGMWLPQLKQCSAVLCSVALLLVTCLLGYCKHFHFLPISSEYDSHSHGGCGVSKEGRSHSPYSAIFAFVLVNTLLCKTTSWLTFMGYSLNLLFGFAPLVCCLEVALNSGQGSTL